MSLNDGLAFERRNYMACLGTPKQKEKMKAILSKSSLEMVTIEITTCNSFKKVYDAFKFNE